MKTQRKNMLMGEPTNLSYRISKWVKESLMKLAEADIVLSIFDSREKMNECIEEKKDDVSPWHFRKL